MSALYKIFNLGREFVGMSGIPTIVSRATSYKRTVILYYHKPTPNQFESHVKWLVKYYVPVTMQLLLQSIEESKPDLLPAYSVIITIDDGWKENASLLPIIIKYRLPVIFYLTAGIVGTYRKFWWLQVLEKGDNPNPLKKLCYDDMVDTLKRKYDYEFYREYPQRCALTWNEVYELQRSGYVEFGSHTLTHPILPQCPDAIAYKEIFQSKQVLEDKLNQQIIHFAYPNGDFSCREKKTLTSVGYRTGRSTETGWYDRKPKSNLFELKTLYGADFAYNSNQLAYIMSGMDVLRTRIMS